MSTQQTQADRQSSVSIMQAIAAKAAGKSFQENQWGKRHAKAWDQAAMYASGDAADLPRSLVLMIRGWVAYADAHRKAYESGVTEDGMLGREWERIGIALRNLLCGNLGPLDGGTLDSILCEVFENEGVEI
jgi:hypothetical protein